MEMACQMSSSTLDNHCIRTLTHISCNHEAYMTGVGLLQMSTSDCLQLNRPGFHGALLTQLDEQLTTKSWVLEELGPGGREVTAPAS